MRHLLKNLKIIGEGYFNHDELVDICIEDGIISAIGTLDMTADLSINLKGCVCTNGLFDTSALLTDPGFEHKEDAYSITESALAGGFTGICLLPNTFPLIQTKGEVKQLLNNSTKVSFHPFAALSEDTLGENLTEILDLNDAGAIAFTDGINPIWNSELLLKGLQYVSKFDGLIVQRPNDIHLSKHTHMHEGPVSTSLGIKGVPRLSEEVVIKRDIDILKYAGGRLHFSQISSEGSVQIIRKAKEEGLNVTCDVNFHHLIFTDEDLRDYDTHYKFDPPLRESMDRHALIEGLKDDTIDAICSGHLPHDLESKQLEFDLADFGAIGLQVVTAALNTHLPELELTLLFNKLSASARNIFKLSQSEISVGQKANLNIFDPSISWKFDSKTCLSKSRNSPFMNQSLKGKTVGVFVNGVYYEI
ncbi:MAG: dihydroorotase [Cyclobacteriaceae bacterium]